MSDPIKRSSTELALGEEFWTQPDALRDNFAFIYMQFASALRDEVRERGGSVLELAIAERLAFSYAYLRQRENDGEEGLTDRTRREMNKDFLETTMALRKMWGVEDSKNVAEAVLRKVNASINSALSEVPTEQARALQKQFAEQFELAGL